MKRTITSEQVNKILELHAQGLKQHKIAQEVGITQALVSYYLRANGIRCQTSQKERLERIDKIKALALEGFSTTEIIEQLGCDKHVVYNVLRSEGIECKHEYSKLPYEKWINEEAKRIAECEAKPKQYAKKRCNQRVVYFGKRYIDETSIYS